MVSAHSSSVIPVFAFVFIQFCTGKLDIMDSQDPKNVLLIGKHSTLAEGLLNVAIKQAMLGRTVFYLTSKPVESLPESFGQYERDVQKKIIFMYFKSLDALIQKLMDFQSMCTPPSLFIIESLHNFFPYQPNQPAKSLDFFMKQHSFIFAALHNCVQSFDGRFNDVCWSIVTLDDNAYHYGKSLTTFIDLFYFKKNVLRVHTNFVDCNWIDELMVKYVK